MLSYHLPWMHCVNIRKLRICIWRKNVGFLMFYDEMDKTIYCSLSYISRSGSIQFCSPHELFLLIFNYCILRFKKEEEKIDFWIFYDEMDKTIYWRLSYVSPSGSIQFCSPHEVYSVFIKFTIVFICRFDFSIAAPSGTMS